MTKAKTTTEITLVKFYNELNGILAVFPNTNEFNGYRNDLLTCYSHVGQHSTCAPDYLNTLNLATPEQYFDLKSELESIGYKLQIVTPVKKGDNITIIGRRWFDRINGNTYFSASGLVNGVEVVHIPFEYGYGNQYEHRIFQELEKAGYCTDVEHYSNGSNEAFWRYCDRKGITKYVTHSDVNRKKDL